MFRLFTLMMEIYVIEHYRDVYPELSGSELTDMLIKDCLAEAGFDEVDVLRTEKGKPYVKWKPCIQRKPALYISVSHSGVYFVYAAANRPIGVDIQKHQKVNVEGISRRYFSPDERKYIEEYGEKGFFTLWTRKEAYGKYTGLGLEEIIRGTEILDREDVDFYDFQLEDGLYCSCCIMKGNEE